MHTVKVNLIANRQIQFRESLISVYDIESIALTPEGEIEQIILKTSPESPEQEE